MQTQIEGIEHSAGSCSRINPSFSAQGGFKSPLNVSIDFIHNPVASASGSEPPGSRWIAKLLTGFQLLGWAGIIALGMSPKRSVNNQRPRCRFNTDLVNQRRRWENLRISLLSTQRSGYLKGLKTLTDTAGNSQFGWRGLRDVVVLKDDQDR